MSNRSLIVSLVAFLVVVGAMWGTILALGWQPQLGLDLRGGVTTTLIPAPGQGEIEPDKLDQTVAVIRSRVDALGVAEPDITRQGDAIVVQLPGVKNRDRALALVGQTAELQFRPVLTAGALPDDEVADAQAAADAQVGGAAADDGEDGEGTGDEGGSTSGPSSARRISPANAWAAAARERSRSFPGQKCVSISLRAPAAVAASPTTSMSPAWLRISTSPQRTTSWSSTRKTRTVRAPAAFPPASRTGVSLTGSPPPDRR